jgi:hypothetical protein
MTGPRGRRIAWVGLLIGFLLNLTGWFGNNFLLGGMWEGVGATLSEVPWRSSIWRDVVSFVPDYVYGFAIAWLCAVIRPLYDSYIAASVRVGVFVAIVGGITTYLGIANSGFIPWSLAFASFVLVVATKLPLSVLAGRMLETR